MSATQTHEQVKSTRPRTTPAVFAVAGAIAVVAALLAGLLVVTTAGLGELAVDALRGIPVIGPLVGAADQIADAITR